VTTKSTSYFSNPKINTTTNMKYHGVLTITYLYQKFHNGHTHKLRIARVHITTTKYTIESKIFYKIHKFNLGRLQPWVRTCDRESSTGGSTGWRRAGARLRTTDGVAPANSTGSGDDELRRAGARGGQQSSGDEGLCSRERRTQGAVWHGERTEWTYTTPRDMSSRFIESRGREKVGQGERTVGVFNGHRCVSYRRRGRKKRKH
jgi:hypothetical protein